MSTSTKKSKTSAADNDRFNEIDALITTPANKERLVAAKSADELRTIAEELGVDTGRDSSDMGKFIHKLKVIGVDFVAMAKADAAQRRAGLAEKAEAMAERADELPFVRLWSGAVENDEDASGAYGIVDAEGTAIWYGSFSTRFEKIRKAGDLISAEQSAADKAVYAASKVREAVGLEEISLWLTTTCPELDEAALKASGARLGVAVDITVDDADESAVRMAEAPGYRSLKNVTEEELKALVETDAEGDADTGESVNDTDEDAADVGEGEDFENE